MLGWEVAPKRELLKLFLFDCDCDRGVAPYLPKVERIWIEEEVGLNEVSNDTLKLLVIGDAF